MRTVRTAEAQVARLEAAVARWSTEADTKRQELQALEATVGDTLLADETGTAARRLAVDAQELQFSIDGAHAAARAAALQLRDARWDLALSQAAEKRERAAELRAEAGRRQQKIEELVGQLQAFEGGDWRPYEPTREEIHQAGAAGVVMPARRTPALLMEAEQLEAQAAGVETRVADEKRRAADVEPTATVRWNLDGYRVNRGHTDAQIVCSVGEAGVGSATFQVLQNGRQIYEVTLPDEQGRRGWTEFLEDGWQGDTVEVRCDGKVLASETLRIPEQRITHHIGTPGLLGLPQ